MGIQLEEVAEEIDDTTVELASVADMVLELALAVVLINLLSHNRDRASGRSYSHNESLVKLDKLSSSAQVRMIGAPMIKYQGVQIIVIQHRFWFSFAAEFVFFNELFYMLEAPHQ